MSLLSTRASRILALLLLLTAIGVRGGWIMANMDMLRMDEDSYAHVAEVWLKTGTFAHGIGIDPAELAPTAHRPPVYPLMIALFAGSDGEILLHRLALMNLVMSVGIVVFVFLLAREVAPKRTLVPLVAAALAIFDPLLLERSGHVMSESPAALFAVIFSWLSVRTYRRSGGIGWLLAGLVLGIAALCRPTFLVAMPVVCLTIWFAEGLRAEGTAWRRVWSGWKMGFLCGLGCLIALSPWVIRNYNVFGKFIVGTTHGGHTLALSNSPEYYAHIEQNGFGAPWNFQVFNERIANENSLFEPMDPDGPGYRSLSPSQEVAMDEAFHAMAWDWIRANPSAFGELVRGRLAQFWKPLPGPLEDHQGWKEFLFRWGSCAWYSMIYLLILVGLPLGFHQGWLSRQLAWVLPLTTAFTLVHLVFWVNMRMRTPLCPMLSLLAGAGAVALFEFLRQRRWEALKLRASRSASERELLEESPCELARTS